VSGVAEALLVGCRKPESAGPLLRTLKRQKGRKKGLQWARFSRESCEREQRDVSWK